MIGFFRNIRRKLANENRFIQYSRYAIGEILLVVIGILLALQVNNWNEERKANNLRQKLYKKTLIDIEYEQASLQELYNDFKVTMQSYNHIYEEIKGIAGRDTVNNPYNNLRWTLIMDLVVSNNLAMETNISDLKIIGLINEKAKIEDRLNFVLNNYNNFKSDIVNPFLTTHGVFNIEKAYDKMSVDFYNFAKLNLIRYDKLRVLFSNTQFKQILFELKSKSLYIIVQIERLVAKNDEIKRELENAYN